MILYAKKNQLRTEHIFFIQILKLNNQLFPCAMISFDGTLKPKYTCWKKRSKFNKY